MQDLAPLPAFTSFEATHLRSIAHLIPRGRKRCGIYVLRFANGDCYVGQSTDMVGRFAAHRRHWDDIVAIEVAAVPRRGLDDIERRTLFVNERSHPVRNVSMAGNPAGETDLDPHVTVDEQLAWLARGETLPDISDRVDDPAQRERLHQKFAQFEAYWLSDMWIPVIADYIRLTIPRPRETERTFWALSAMPTTNRTRQSRRVFTLSINKMETLVGGENLVGFTWLPDGFLNVSRSLLDAADLRDLPRLGGQDVLAVFESDYDTAGEDQANVQFAGPLGLLLALSMPSVVAAARDLNLRLMRKGPTFQWRWHNFDLADQVLDGGLLTADDVPDDPSYARNVATEIILCNNLSPQEWTTESDLADWAGMADDARTTVVQRLIERGDVEHRNRSGPDGQTITEYRVASDPL